MSFFRHGHSHGLEKDFCNCMLIKLIIFILSTCSLLSADQTSSIKEYVQISKDQRPIDIYDSLNRALNDKTGNQARKQEADASEKLWNLAFDYTKNNSLEDSIRNFLESVMNLLIHNLNCVNSARIDIKESVFIDHKLGVVVKVFPRREENFYKALREISGNEAIRNMQLQSGDTVALLAMGKCTVNGKDNLMLAMTLAPGREIRKFLEDIFSAKDRAAAIKECKKILVLLGRTIGELHRKNAVPLDHTSKFALAVPAFIEINIKNHLEKYRSNWELYYEDLRDLFAFLIKNYDANGTYLTIHHGDAHLDNFLFDQDTERIAVIDTPRIHLAVDPAGKPICTAYIHDIARAEDDIAKWVLYSEYNELLIQELIDAFHQGYDPIAGDLITPSQLDLDRAYTLMTRWRSVLDWENEKDPAEREIKQRIFARCQTYFVLKYRIPIPQERNFP